LSAAALALQVASWLKKPNVPLVPSAKKLFFVLLYET